MVSLAQVWAPILLSAFLVFLSSSLIHMVFKWHASDYRKLPNEDAVRAAIRAGSPAPAQYHMPYCSDMKEMGDPAMQTKWTEGPVALLTVLPNKVPAMGPMLGAWFVLNIVISFFAAYIGVHALPIGTAYPRVFQVIGAVGFMSYGLGTIAPSIWMGKPWSITWKDLLDALIYGCMMGGAFGWLWPQA